VKVNEQVKFCKDHSGFYAKVRERADHYFASNGISRHADGLMIFKTVFFLGGTLSLYLLILSDIFPVWAMFLMAIGLGVFSAFIGFNVCHDALHGSYSGNSFVNTALGSVFHLLGANVYNWKISHNLVHHTFTNIHEHDDDLVVAPGLVSVCPQESPLPIQRYQHYYMVWRAWRGSLRKTISNFFRIELVVMQHQVIRASNSSSSFSLRYYIMD
jgi:linoleoyl-CoA desaturase